MKFVVYDVSGRVLYDGGSWPMARAALDFVVAKGGECPRLEITPEAEE